MTTSWCSSTRSGACSATTHWCAAAGPHRPKAGVRRLRFHDLRHSFGTMAVRQFPITDVQTWMGHADIATTRKYIRYAPQPEAAALLGVLVSEQLGPWADVRGAGEQHAGFSFVAAGEPVASEP